MVADIKGPPFSKSLDLFLCLREDIYIAFHLSRKKLEFIEFMFIWEKISLLELSLRKVLKTLMQSFAYVTSDTWDPHSSRLKFEISFSCQLKTWDSCLINISFNSLDHFLFRWSLPLFKWCDLNFFVLFIRYRFLSS